MTWTLLLGNVLNVKKTHHDYIPIVYNSQLKQSNCKKNNKKNVPDYFQRSHCMLC